DSRALRVVRTAPTIDAGILVLARSDGGEPPALMKVTQSGAIVFRRGLELDPADGCTWYPADIARDGGSGFYGAGGCTDEKRTALVHVDDVGTVLGVRYLAGASADDRAVFTNLFAIGGDIVLFGRTFSPTDAERMYAVRVGDAGAPSFAMRYDGCT